MDNKALQAYSSLITINLTASTLAENKSIIIRISGCFRFMSLALFSLTLLTLSACSPSPNHISQNWAASEQTDLPKIFVEPIIISNSAQLPVIHGDSGAILTNMLSGILYQRKLLQTDKRIHSLRLAGTILYYENNKLYVRGDLYDENEYLVYSQFQHQFTAGSDWNQELGLVAMRLMDELMYKLSLLENQQYALSIQFYFSNGRSYGDYRNSGIAGTHHTQEPVSASQHRENHENHESREIHENHSPERQHHENGRESEHVEHHDNNDRSSHLESHNDKPNYQENRALKEKLDKKDKKDKHNSADTEARDKDADKRSADFDQSAGENGASAFPSFQYRYNGSSGLESQQPTPKPAIPVVGLPLSPATSSSSNSANPSGSIGSVKGAALIPTSVSGSQPAGSLAPLPSAPSSSSSLPDHGEQSRHSHSTSPSASEPSSSPATSPLNSVPSSSSGTPDHSEHGEHNHHSNSSSPSYNQPSGSPAPSPVYSAPSSSPSSSFSSSPSYSQPSISPVPVPVYSSPSSSSTSSSSSSPSYSQPSSSPAPLPVYSTPSTSTSSSTSPPSSSPAPALSPSYSAPSPTPTVAPPASSPVLAPSPAKHHDPEAHH